MKVTLKSIQNALNTKCSNSATDSQFKHDCIIFVINLLRKHGGIQYVEIHIKSDKHEDAGKKLESK